MRSRRSPGAVLAGYEVENVLGIGTYGEVRCARRISTGERVAVKIVDASRFDAETSEVVMKEIAVLKRIHHRHTIGLREVKERVDFYGSFCSNCACSEFASVPRGRGAGGGKQAGGAAGAAAAAAGAGGDGEGLSSDGAESVSAMASAFGEGGDVVAGSTLCLNCSHERACHSERHCRSVIFMVEELAAAGELFSLLRHCGPFQEDLARYYFRQLINGVEHLHAMGVVHRDLKPENLVFDADFTLKMVDFGLAAYLNEAGVLHSGVGSQPYSAPEVYYSEDLYHNSGYDGRAADVWSCAVILFVMLTGRPPFVRPLTQTYGPEMRRCKHYVNILRGKGYGDMSAGARDLLFRLFQPDPTDRLTIQQIKGDAWYNGPVPSEELVAKVMREKATTAWMSQRKTGMVEILTKMRAKLAVTPVLSPLGMTTFGSMSAFKLDRDAEHPDESVLVDSPPMASPAQTPLELQRESLDNATSPVTTQRRVPQNKPVPASQTPQRQRSTESTSSGSDDEDTSAKTYPTMAGSSSAGSSSSSSSSSSTTTRKPQTQRASTVQFSTKVPLAKAVALVQHVVSQVGMRAQVDSSSSKMFVTGEFRAAGPLSCLIRVDPANPRAFPYVSLVSLHRTRGSVECFREFVHYVSQPLVE